VSDLVPSADAIAAFEALRQGHVEGLFAPGLLTGEQIIAGLLLRIAQQNDALYQALTGKPSPVTAPGAPVQTVVSVSFSLDPGVLNEILVATPELAGYVIPTANELALNVPAGGQATLTIPAPPGFVLTFVGPLAYSTTDVSAQMSAQVYVDGANLVGVYGFVMGPGGNLPTGQIYAQQQVVLVLNNPSASNVTAYFTVEIVAVARFLYNKFIAELRNKAHEAIKSAFGLVVP
jgi:hypothetical protein